MATIFPPPSSGIPAIVDQSPPQNLYPGAPRPRSYTPYIFQPNFMKQQLKQRMNEILPGMPDYVSTGANSVPLGDRDKLSRISSQQPTLPANSLPQINSSNTQNAQTSYLDDIAGRKKSGRKVIDWTSSCALYLENRRFDREIIDVPDLLPDTSFTMEMQSVIAYKTNPVTSITSKFIRSATNKMKCPVYKVVWTPDGRRLVTGSASGEFTLWNGTAFNFETILQAHDCPVRAMAWSKHDNWLITGDNQGYIKYWQLNMNNVKMYQAHKDQACRSVTFGPTDHKFATASDDGTVRIWDFLRCHEERILRGHGADVKQVDWHPMKGIVASASKDLHTPVKLWDPKMGNSIATLHAHKGTVMDVKWNKNGNWILSASRDHLVKLYDIRNLKQEMQVFRGHKKEAFSVAWHPIHEDLFASGGSEGSILFWQVGEEKEAGTLEGAHESLIWSLAWHPLGHVLVSGSNDHSTKFWARSRPGDSMRDRYNLCLLPQTQDEPTSTTNIGSVRETSDNSMQASVIPGMGDADVAAAEVAKRDEEEQKSGIPGLDWSYEEKNEFDRKISNQFDRKKFAYARPVPRAFVAAWEANKEGAPPERPRSPRFHDRDRDFGRQRWRDRFDERPRDHGPPFRQGREFRNGPGDKDSERGGDDDRIFVDGVEVGPDFNPDEITGGDRVSPDRSDGRRRSPMRGNDRLPPRGAPNGPPFGGPERRMSRRDRSPIGGPDGLPRGGPVRSFSIESERPDRPHIGGPERLIRDGPDRRLMDGPERRPIDGPQGSPTGGLDRLPMGRSDRPPLSMLDRPPVGRPPMGMPDRLPMSELDRPPMGMDGPDKPLIGGPDMPVSETDIPPLMGLDSLPMGGPDRRERSGPPSPHRGRRPSNADVGPSPQRQRDLPTNHKLRDDLYQELLRSGSDRDMELMRELEEHGLSLEDGLEPEIYYDENGDPINPMGNMQGPNDMQLAGRSRFPSQDGPPRFNNDMDSFRGGRGRGFCNMGDRGGGRGGFPAERGFKGRGSRPRRSPPPRMRRGRGGPQR